MLHYFFHTVFIFLPSARDNYLSYFLYPLHKSQYNQHSPPLVSPCVRHPNQYELFLSYYLANPTAMILFLGYLLTQRLFPFLPYAHLLSFYCAGIVMLFLSFVNQYFKCIFIFYFVNFRIGVYSSEPIIYCKYSRGTTPTLFFRLFEKFKNDRMSNHSAIL